MPSRCLCPVVLAILLAAGCAEDGAGEAGMVVPGAGLIWLVSNEPKVADAKYYESRPRADIAGVVTGVEAGPAAPPPALRKFFYVDGGASQVLTIAGDDGLQWSLGYHLERGEPAVDATPDLRALAGTRVSLLFRAVRAFGTAPGFVLSGPDGVRFAMDLAVYGDPLLPDDVPGLTVADGPVLIKKKHPCADQNHTALVFTGDAAVNVAGGSEADVMIKGQRYRAINLFCYRAAGPIQCTDITGEGRGLAVWRAP
jgi:hypothetical protein